MEYKNQEDSGFKWFDRSHIKNIEKLSKEDIKWLSKASFSFFTPFSLLLREQWDLFLIAVVLVAILPHPYGSLVSILSTIISVKDLRRLVWNRGSYKTLEEYKKSEAKWNNWGVFFLILYILLIVGVVWLFS